MPASSTLPCATRRSRRRLRVPQRRPAAGGADLCRQQGNRTVARSIGDVASPAQFLRLGPARPERLVDASTPPAQKRVSDVLGRLADPAYDHSLGLYGEQLLGSASPARLAWSVVLYERGGNCNFVRIRADSLNEPFDLNAGAKLQLGSTAKLRTLITYLDIVDTLHDRFAGMPRAKLLAIAAASAKDDPITHWAAEWVAKAHDPSLQAMLDAAMNRSYSASPGSYFTGGGMQSFANFAKWENHAVPTVALAFADFDQQRLHPLDARYRQLRDCPGWDPSQRVAEGSRRSGADGLSATLCRPGGPRLSRSLLA